MEEKKSYHEVRYDSIECETDMAYQLLIGKTLVWLPKSQVVIYKVSKRVEIPGWLYAKKFSPGADHD